jgi:hypothetical protein
MDTGVCMIWYLAITYQHGIGIAMNAMDGTIGISTTKRFNFGTNGLWGCYCAWRWKHDATNEVLLYWNGLYFPKVTVWVSPYLHLAYVFYKTSWRYPVSMSRLCVQECYSLCSYVATYRLRVSLWISVVPCWLYVRVCI